MCEINNLMDNNFSRRIKNYESSLKNAESWKEFYMKQEFDVFAYELLNNAIKNVIITSIKDELQ